MSRSHQTHLLLLCNISCLFHFLWITPHIVDNVCSRSATYHIANTFTCFRHPLARPLPIYFLFFYHCSRAPTAGKSIRIKGREFVFRLANAKRYCNGNSRLKSSPSCERFVCLTLHEYPSFRIPIPYPFGFTCFDSIPIYLFRINFQLCSFISKLIEWNKEYNERTHALRTSQFEIVSSCAVHLFHFLFSTMEEAPNEWRHCNRTWSTICPGTIRCCWFFYSINRARNSNGAHKLGQYNLIWLYVIFFNIQ